MNNPNPFDSLESKLSDIEASLIEIKQYLAGKPRVEQKYYSIADAAEKLGVATITLYRGTKNGTIPCKKVGIRTMIPGSFVDGPEYFK